MIAILYLTFISRVIIFSWFEHAVKGIECSNQYNSPKEP